MQAEQTIFNIHHLKPKGNKFIFTAERGLTNHGHLKTMLSVFQNMLFVLFVICKRVSSSTSLSFFMFILD